MPGESLPNVACFVMAVLTIRVSRQTLHALGALLQHVEAKGEQSGLDVSSGEFHFLDLFRCVVEEDKVLTPLISDGIRHQLTQRDLQNPRVEVRNSEFVASASALCGDSNVMYDRNCSESCGTK